MKTCLQNALTLGLLLFQSPAWACNCISSGASQRVLDTYLGITLLLSLLPLLLGGGAIWWVWKQGRS